MQGAEWSGHWKLQNLVTIENAIFVGGEATIFDPGNGYRDKQAKIRGKQTHPRKVEGASEDTLEPLATSQKFQSGNASISRFSHATSPGLRESTSAGSVDAISPGLRGPTSA
jgi:hypothetical protein